LRFPTEVAEGGRVVDEYLFRGDFVVPGGEQREKGSVVERAVFDDRGRIRIRMYSPATGLTYTLTISL
jgi:hypothetical protein